MCRFTIRQSIGRKRIQRGKIEKLHLPKMMKNYLAYEKSEKLMQVNSTTLDLVQSIFQIIKHWKKRVYKKTKQSKIKIFAKKLSV